MEPAGTFEQAYRLYLAHHGRISKRTKDFYHSYLRNHFGDWAERQMAEMTQQDILAGVDAVQQNSPGSAVTILRLISAMFRLHLIGTSKRNPVVVAIEMLQNDGKVKDQSNIK